MLPEEGKRFYSKLNFNYSLGLQEKLNFPRNLELFQLKFEVLPIDTLDNREFI